MKLRNKSNGEILEIKLIQTNCECLAEHEVETLYGEKLSLKTLNKYYDDYAPTGPLIKDEKICKAVRVWADASGITRVLSYGDISWLGLRSVNTESVWKFECFYTDTSEFKLDKEYTIAELCGEEEE